MTDLEAFHWLKKMSATVLLDADSDYTVVIVPLGSRDVVTGTAPSNLTVSHHDAIIEVRANSLADATEQALQMWRARGPRSAVDSLADLQGAPKNISSGVCPHCRGATVERTEMGETFKLERVILCTACDAKTFISPEGANDARAQGGVGKC